MSSNQSSQEENKDRIIIFDTTLRDGDQAPGYAMKISEKLEIAHTLAGMHVDVIEAGFPISSKYDFKAVKRIAAEVKGPRIAALARAKERDIFCAAEALEGCECSRIHTFIATSEKHMRDKLRMTPETVLAAIDMSVGLSRDYMKGRGDVEWSAEDASGSSMGFLVDAIRVAIKAGATTINLPDTLGYMQPKEYESIFRQVIAEIKPQPDIVFSAHAHNDLGLAVSNTLAAFKGGARQAECTINGIGERAGSAQMEAVVANLKERGDVNPFRCFLDTQKMKRASDLHSSYFPDAPSVTPIVGDNAFAHSSGIHQDGMKKGACYEIMNPEDYGHKGTSFPLTRHSGVAGIISVLEEKGVFLQDVWRDDFARVFKGNAAEVLENRSLRVVPAEMVVEWANAWAKSRGIARLPSTPQVSSLSL